MPTFEPPTFELYVDRKSTTTLFPELVEAKAAGAKLSKPDNFVHIESLEAPAPSRGWRYDREDDLWVETSLPIGDDEP